MKRFRLTADLVWGKTLRLVDFTFETDPSQVEEFGRFVKLACFGPGVQVMIEQIEVAPDAVAWPVA